MQRYEHQTSFFLNKQENEAFVKYCKSKNVAPYIAGRTIVKDFMMSTEDTVEQMIINNDYEERMSMLESRIEAMVSGLSCQVEKCEKLEEEIAFLQEEVVRLATDETTTQIEGSLSRLWASHHGLVKTVVPKAD